LPSDDDEDEESEPFDDEDETEEEETTKILVKSILNPKARLINSRAFYFLTRNATALPISSFNRSQSLPGVSIRHAATPSGSAHTHRLRQILHKMIGGMVKKGTIENSRRLSN
jgi:hypothetical protein